MKKGILAFILFIATGFSFAWADPIHDAVNRSDLSKGFFYLVDKLNSNTIFPMHGSDSEYTYLNYKNQAMEKGYKANLVCAENKEDAFMYRVSK
jgi:hypothetical protein